MRASGELVFAVFCGWGLGLLLLGTGWADRDQRWEFYAVSPLRCSSRWPFPVVWLALPQPLTPRLSEAWRDDRLPDDLTEAWWPASCCTGSFAAYRDTVRLPDGSEATRIRQAPAAVVVIPLLDDGRVVVERQFRYPGAEMIEFPAGKLDAGEDPLRCASANCWEETGYTAREWARAVAMHPSIAHSTKSSTSGLHGASRRPAPARRGRISRCVSAPRLTSLLEWSRSGRADRCQDPDLPGLAPERPVGRMDSGLAGLQACPGWRIIRHEGSDLQCAHQHPLKAGLFRKMISSASWRGLVGCPMWKTRLSPKC